MYSLIALYRKNKPISSNPVTAAPYPTIRSLLMHIKLKSFNTKTSLKQESDPKPNIGHTKVLNGIISYIL